MMSPLSYHLCHQTVTIYRLQGGKVCRFVTENAYLSHETRRKGTVSGAEGSAAFRLILPAGEAITLLPGDRVYAGVGPAVTKEQWLGFLPATVPGLCVVGYVKPYYWEGEHCHTEAGNA